MDLARGLASLGLNKGDRCVIFAESRPEWIIADQAIQACGATGVPLYPTLSRDDLMFMVIDSESKMAIVSTRAKADEFLGLRDSHEGLKSMPVISMEEWEGPRRENVYSFMDIMRMGREKITEEEIESRITSVTPETIAAIIYTSGTTGRSKGCRAYPVEFRIQHPSGIRFRAHGAYEEKGCPTYSPGSSALMPCHGPLE